MRPLQSLQGGSNWRSCFDEDSQSTILHGKWSSDLHYVQRSPHCSGFCKFEGPVKMPTRERSKSKRRTFSRALPRYEGVACGASMVLGVLARSRQRVRPWAREQQNNCDGKLRRARPEAWFLSSTGVRRPITAAAADCSPCQTATQRGQATTAGSRTPSGVNSFLALGEPSKAAASCLRPSSLTPHGGISRYVGLVSYVRTSPYHLQQWFQMRCWFWPQHPWKHTMHEMMPRRTGKHKGHGDQQSLPQIMACPVWGTQRVHRVALTVKYDFGHGGARRG
eukprot:320552-Chlamydomonas_euryale.AAC.23